MTKLTIQTLVALGTLGLSAISQAAPISAPIQNPANNHFYTLLSSDTWTASQSQALGLGGNLVTINNAAENAWVVTTFMNYGGVTRDLWTGLNDAATEGTFQWVSGESFTYSNWEPGTPDNGAGYVPNENYVHIYGGGTTRDTNLGWQVGRWNDYEDLASYGTFLPNPPVREIFGVVEVVPEPSINVLLLATGSLLVWLRSRNQKKAVA